MKKVTYEGKQGYLDEGTNQFFSKEVFEEVTYEGKRGLLHSGSNKFFEVDDVPDDNITHEEVPPSLREKVLRKGGVFASGANKGLSGVLGTPVDLINLALSAAGIGSDKPVMGSEWIKENVMPAPVKPEGLAENILHSTGEQIPYVASSFIPGMGAASKAESIKNQIIQGAKFAGGAGVGGGIAQTVAPDNELAALAGQTAGGLSSIPVRMAIDAITKTKLPERIYGSSVKAPLSRKWLKTMGPEDVSMREEAIAAGLKSHIRPTEFGKELTTKITRDIGGAIEESASNAAKLGVEEINVSGVVNRGMAKAYADASNASNPIRARAYLDSIKEGFLSGRGETIPIDKANQWKQHLYKEVTWPESVAKTLPMQMRESAFKGVANELMTDMEKKWPELSSLNKEYGPYKNLEEVITKAVAREGNKDIVPLSSKVLFNPKYWILGVWDATLGNPTVKSQIAFTLDKARTLAGGSAKTGVKSVEEIESMISNMKRPSGPTTWEPIPSMAPQGAETSEEILRSFWIR